MLQRGSDTTTDRPSKRDKTPHHRMEAPPRKCSWESLHKPAHDVHQANPTPLRIRKPAHWLCNTPTFHAASRLQCKATLDWMPSVLLPLCPAVPNTVSPNT